MVLSWLCEFLLLSSSLQLLLSKVLFDSVEGVVFLVANARTKIDAVAWSIRFRCSYSRLMTTKIVFLLGLGLEIGSRSIRS